MPGLNGADAAAWWSGFFIWTSWLCIGGLVVSVYLSQHYGARRDILREAQRLEWTEAQQRDDIAIEARQVDEIARVRRKLFDTQAALDTVNARLAAIKVAVPQAAPALATVASQAVAQAIPDPAARHLSQVQQASLAGAIKAFAGQRVVVNYTDGDPEIVAYARDIAQALRAAHWRVDENKVAAGLPAGVQASATRQDIDNGGLLPPAKALVLALSQQGIMTKNTLKKETDMPPVTIALTIGARE